MFAINQRLGAADPIPVTLEFLPQFINNTGLLEALRIFKVRILCTGALTICPYEHWSYALVFADSFDQPKVASKLKTAHYVSAQDSAFCVTVRHVPDQPDQPQVNSKLKTV